MADLHEALASLAKTSWDSVPKDNLEPYLRDIFAAGELICNSVPELPDGTPFHDSRPHHTTPNTAKSHKDVHVSDARAPPPHDEHAKLAKNWGKPMSFKKAANPHNVSLYKMAGRDRHGAWFARRSVHEGLGFDKFKRAMLREFPESMLVKGGPGAGAVRGLAAEQRVEQKDVEGVGKLEVYELSSAFPGPVTPRDFVTMLMSSDNTLSEQSAAELQDGKKHMPRHLMLVSRPIEHPAAPPRAGLVRGYYESVELIREIPISPAKSKSTPDLLSSPAETDQIGRDRAHTVSAADVSQGEHVPAAAEEGDPELNPVEWIMVTRSDPGGGLPRFLVERGTPEPMLSDVSKFLDWACKFDRVPDPEEGFHGQHATITSGTITEKDASRENSTGLANGRAQQEHSTAPSSQTAAESASRPTSQGGIISNITQAIGAGIETYAPTALAERVHPYLHTGDTDISDDSSDSSSVKSFMSAETSTHFAIAPELPARPADSTDVLSVASTDLPEAGKDVKNMTHHEKEVYKLTQKREKLEQQLAKKRLAEQEKLKQTQEKEASDSTKAREEMEKKLKKTEEKHRKEMEKLEHKKQREQRKVEEKRRKKDSQHQLSLVSRERDEFRSQVDLFRRENDLLREQVADLQKQNTSMAQKLQPDALRALQEEFSHKRSRSLKSVASAASGDSQSMKS